MSNDNKTLADVQPGGAVRLGDQAERARFEAWAEDRELGTAKCSADGMKGDYADLSTDWCWAAWQAALSAQPSPGGQGDALRVIAERLRGAGANLPAPPITGTIAGSMVTGLSIALALVEEALAARQPSKQPDSVALGEATEFCIEKGVRQPVVQIDEAAVLRRAAAVLYMWEDDPNLTGHMGDFNDACGILELLAQHAAPPAQAVDLPYSLDADPAGIRARVADVITGTLMVAAQGHTPPPAGHWAVPFWQAARHDAARSLNVALRLRELVAASKYMRDRVVETRGVKCMDDLDYAINEADKALIDSQAVGK